MSSGTPLNSERMIDARIVLVRPRNPLNIGAAARAMANFGFSDLAVVSPYEPSWRDAVSAVGAEALLQNARKVRAPDEVLSDCHLVIGTTTVRDRRRIRPVIRLPDLNAYLEQRASDGPIKAAILFGSEKTGLTETYLERCNIYLTVPTAPAQPSMNLSHAVAVCCYELSKFDPAKKFFGARTSGVRMATIDDRERLAQEIFRLFQASGYLEAVAPSEKLRAVRQTLLQWNLRAADVRLMHGLLRRLLKQFAS